MNGFAGSRPSTARRPSRRSWSLWLVQIGASPDLVKAALRIARQELGHATASHRVYVAACGRGPRAAGPALDRASLELARRPGDPLEDDVARACVEVFCLGETVAVRLFRELRQRCDVPVARRTLDRVLRDEVGHRDFGWTLLSWLLELPQHGPRLRELVIAELPGTSPGCASSTRRPRSQSRRRSPATTSAGASCRRRATGSCCRRRS